jgi:hypothetical protein
MGFEITLILTLTALAACAFFGWRGMRPPDPTRGPRLIPHRFLMVLSGAVLLFLVTHLVNLSGVTTG